MPLTPSGIYYADTSTTLSIADITAAMATSIGTAMKFVQVVEAKYSLAVSNSTTTYAPTGLSATITPKYATSKILVIVNQNGVGKGAGNLNSGVWLRLVRNGTSLSEFACNYFNNQVSQQQIGQASTIQFDSPNTTSATTYTTEFKNNVAAASVSCQNYNSVSSMILIEIAA